MVGFWVVAVAVTKPGIDEDSVDKGGLPYATLGSAKK
jgi:hypothetical protein